MPSRPNEFEILTIKQVAAYLQVTERTIYRLAGGKEIPAFKVGGTWRFSRQDIDGWIRKQTVATPDGDTRTASNKRGKK
ncbi:helix-turn-helix domain-containing protein [Luteibacter sp. NPDC031894]|uniref:helix-turn-helix domain-containing protein n=1 Tax=Luteibacter sp. NPDC031894 TaxID=3390572 RepID=UPI003D03359E